MPKVDEWCDSMNHWMHKLGGLEVVKAKANQKLDIEDQIPENDRQAGEEGTDEIQQESVEGKGTQESSFSSWKNVVGAAGEIQQESDEGKGIDVGIL